MHLQTKNTGIFSLKKSQQPKYWGVALQSDLRNSTPLLNPWNQINCDITCCWTLCRALWAIKRRERKINYWHWDVTKQPRMKACSPVLILHSFLSELRDTTRQRFSACNEERAPLRQICVSLITQDPGHTAKRSICTAANIQKKPHRLERPAADDRSL